MLYAKSDAGQHIIVLEPANIRHLKDAGVVKSPDNEVIILYTPDAEWLIEQLGDVENDAGKFAARLELLIAEGKDRPAIERLDHTNGLRTG